MDKVEAKNTGLLFSLLGHLVLHNHTNTRDTYQRKKRELKLSLMYFNISNQFNLHLGQFHGTTTRVEQLSQAALPEKIE